MPIENFKILHKVKQRGKSLVDHAIDYCTGIKNYKKKMKKKKKMSDL